MARQGQNRLNEDVLSWFSGGIEPIAEASGDGEELPQEATKFIKKKPSVKKVKKGRKPQAGIHLPNVLHTAVQPAERWLSSTVRGFVKPATSDRGDVSDGVDRPCLKDLLRVFWMSSSDQTSSGMQLLPSLC